MKAYSFEAQLVPQHGSHFVTLLTINATTSEHPRNPKQQEWMRTKLSNRLKIKSRTRPLRSHSLSRPPMRFSCPRSSKNGNGVREGRLNALPCLRTRKSVGLKGPGYFFHRLSTVMLSVFGLQIPFPTAKIAHEVCEITGCPYPISQFCVLRSS